MVRRLIACATAALAIAMSSPFAVAQQSDSGQIRIAVTDASTKAPLALARVLLSGPVITSELTGSNGEVLFTDVPDGIYRARVVKNGYEAVISPQFEVIEGRAITVSVSLAYYQQLQVIGHVTVHSSTIVSADTITQDSVQRKLSNDLADALNKLSGVSVSTSSDDSDATQTVSLEGHDASQTQLSLDGIPLNAPGSAGNLRGFATDLFTGAGVRLGPQLGGLGGGVNFTTLEPTLSWLSYASLSMGSYGKYNYSLAETGSDGKLGIAVEVTDRYAPSLVDGERYLDTSGLDYLHEGDSSIGGQLLKLHYAFSDSQTLIATFMGSTVDTGLVCLRLDGALPCGYGPNNGSQGNFSLYALTDDALLGDTTVQASIYGMDSGNVENELNRYVNGTLDPNGFATRSRTSGFMINATLPSRERHTIAVQAYGTTSSQSNVPLVPQAIPYYNGAAASSYDALQISDTIHSNDKLTLNENLGVSHASYAPSTFLGSAGATWRPNARDTYALSYSLGGVAAGGTRQTILTDPASLRFDCNGDVAYGSAPGDQPGASSSSSLRVGYTHTIFGGNVSLSLYRQVQSDVVLPVDVNGSVLTALGVVPPGYPALVEPIWDSPAGCNAPPGTPFGASQLYFMTPISGTQRVYEGGEITSYLTFGNLVVQPYYNLTSAVVFTRDPRIDNPYSFVISGQQTPNVPLHKAGIVFDYKSPNSALEYLFDAQYTGSNNPNALPSYTTFDAGVSAQLQHGTLTVAASNITNAYAGIFASPQWEVPYVTLGGMVLPNLARPLAPRQYSMTYTVRFGQGAQQAPSGTAFDLPRGAQGGPGGPGGTNESGSRRQPVVLLGASYLTAGGAVRRQQQSADVQRERRCGGAVAHEHAQGVPGAHRGGEDRCRLPGDDRGAGAAGRDDCLPRPRLDVRAHGHAEDRHARANARRMPDDSPRAGAGRDRAAPLSAWHHRGLPRSATRVHAVRRIVHRHAAAAARPGEFPRLSASDDASGDTIRSAQRRFLYERPAQHRGGNARRTARAFRNRGRDAELDDYGAHRESRNVVRVEPGRPVDDRRTPDVRARRERKRRRRGAARLRRATGAGAELHAGAGHLHGASAVPRQRSGARGAAVAGSVAFADGEPLTLVLRRAALRTG